VTFPLGHGGTPFVKTPLCLLKSDLRVSVAQRTFMCSGKSQLEADRGVVSCRLGGSHASWSCTVEPFLHQKINGCQLPTLHHTNQCNPNKLIAAKPAKRRMLPEDSIRFWEG